jgi:ParB-like chromosome segregation protein Spo0J
MTTIALSKMSVEQLLARFADIGVAQDEALLGNEIGRFNRLFQGMQDIVQELKTRPGDQRRALLSLYTHPNMQVRLKAAKNTLAVAPTEARKLLEVISASEWQPQAGDAGMSLWNLDRGVFKPT